MTDAKELSRAAVADGYRSTQYVAQFSAQGRIKWLENTRGWCLERPIPEHKEWLDICGIYPFSVSSAWDHLQLDLEAARARNAISAVFVTEPLQGVEDSFDRAGLGLCRRFRQHYLTTLERPPEEVISKHHAAESRRACRKVDVEVVACPADFLDQWCGLYGQLVKRHRITDMRRFSRQAFASLLEVPELTAFRVSRLGRTVGAQLFIQQGDLVHSHLAAYDEEGYACGASYAADFVALQHFRGSARAINWGGGMAEDGEDGLSRYKRGWSDDQCWSWLVGEILDPQRYRLLAERTSASGISNYFPAYRCGEFSGSTNPGEHKA